MPKDSISLTVPRECPQCQGVHTVHFVTVYEGINTILRWRCRACSHQWPIARPEPQFAAPVNAQVAASRKTRIEAAELRRRSADLIDRTRDLLAMAEQLRVDAATMRATPPRAS